MEQNPELLFSIIAELQKAKISFSLDVTRENAITILATVPGQRWEIDVFKDGEVEVEVFQSGGQIYDYNHLGEMIRKFAD